MWQRVLSLLKLYSQQSSTGRPQVLLISLPLAILATVCLIHAIQWIDRPFASFLYYGFPGAGSYGDFNWPGLRAGIHYRDLILEAKGLPITSSVDLNEIVSRTPVGETIEYRLRRGEHDYRVSVPVTRFTLQNFFTIFGVSFLNGLIFLIIGITVSFMKPDSPVSRAHFLLCLFVGVFLVTGFELQSTITSSWSYHLNMFAFALYPAAAMHLSLIFPEETGLVRQHPRLPYAFYGFSALLSLAHSGLFVAATRPGVSAETLLIYSSLMLDPIYVNRIYGLLSAAAIVGASLYAIWQSRSVIAKQRSRVVLVGSGFAFVPPTVIQAVVSLTKLVIPFNLSAVTTVIFPAAIGYAIARHNLFDVDVYIKRTVGYVMMTAIVGTAYFIVQTAVSGFVLKPVFGEHAEQIYPIIFALLVVFFFNPVSRRVQEGVDKLFFRKGVDFKTTVAGVSEALTTMVDVQAFVEKIIHTVRTDLFVDRAGVVLLDERTNTSRSTFHGSKFGIESEQAAHAPDPCFGPQDPLLTLLAQEKKLITKYDVAEDPRYSSVRERCVERFEELGTSLALPLYYRDQFAGALALGYKKSGHFYTREDIDLLKTLSTMTSTAIEQSREKGQKAVLMQLFSKHVSPQVAESLWEQREHFLEGGRPKSQSMIVTAMFTDLQGFSTISEKQSPEVLMNWLNTYLEMMTTTVMEYGGVVDDFFGDGIKINFGVPIPRETEEEIRQDTVNAVNCALAMERRMKELNATAAEQGQQPLRMRIGINTGPVVAGSLGSADRMKYTTLGDTVNTAARLESFSKEIDLSHLASTPCRILISESTLRHLGDQFLTERVGELALKGKDQKITAYCVLGAHVTVSRKSASA